MVLFLPQLLLHNSRPEKSKIMMPRAYTILSFSSSGKSQKETVISKVFIDVKSTTTRQIPFINALLWGKWCQNYDVGEASMEPDLPPKVHPTVKLDFVAFFLALMVGCLFASGGETVRRLFGDHKCFHFSSLYSMLPARHFHRPSEGTSQAHLETPWVKIGMSCALSFI